MMWVTAGLAEAQRMQYKRGSVTRSNQIAEDWMSLGDYSQNYIP